MKPELNLKTRYEEISDLHSYMGQLNNKEKDWLNKFAEEYINASFGDKPLHKTKKLRKSCYDRNNARNRCVLTKAKAQGKSTSIDIIFKDYNVEETLSIEDLIDKEKK